MVHTCGVAVGPGGSKYSSMASRKFSRASSSLSPWLATSTSRHCATYQLPYCHTLAENVLFTVRPLRRHGESLGSSLPSRSTCLLVLDGLDDALAGGGAGGEEAGEDTDEEPGEEGGESGELGVVEVDLEAPRAGAEDEEVAEK